ncbi:MAG TPA: shikimate kinase [Candidatus Gracilibacteria bacterium]|nr:shikimate kinase [Candidatus Gracilibacteria bacterium]
MKKWGIQWKAAANPTKSQKNIVLAGLRGTGKSKIGRRLAKKLGFNFIDTDDLVEKKEGQKLATIVREKGWGHFRNLETKIASELENKKRLVIATGGGMFIRQSNAHALKKNGTVVLLKAEAPILAERIGEDPNRPRLTKQKTLKAEMQQLWKEREKDYHSAADLVVDVSGQTRNAQADARKKADEIYTLLKESGRLSC